MRLTFSELKEKIYQHNEQAGVETQFGDKNPLNCYVVFKKENFAAAFQDIESRTYWFRSDNKYFLPNMGGNSIFAYSINGDDGIRLEQTNWKIEYCYIGEK